jgi:hypothetical protein
MREELARMTNDEVLQYSGSYEHGVRLLSYCSSSLELLTYLWIDSRFSFGMSAGALQTYYSRNPYRDTPESVIALIGGIIAFVSAHLCEYKGLTEYRLSLLHISLALLWPVSEGALPILCTYPRSITNHFCSLLSADFPPLLQRIQGK